MDNILNNPQDGTQVIVENPDNGQAQPIVVPEEQYKNLQSDYTKRVESEIAFAVKLVKASPQELASIDDVRVQNAVAKQLYGMDTYAQLVAVRGNNFFVSEDEENIDRTEKLEREIKLLKYKSETEALDNALEDFYSQNKNIVSSEEDKKKLRDELKYISAELPVKERIQRASRVVFGSIPNDISAYKQISVGTSINGGNGSMSQINTKDSEIQKQIEAGRKLLGLK